MIRRILAGTAIAGIAAFAGLATAGVASAGDWNDHRPGFTYVDDSNHNEILNDLIDLALLGIIEN
ncbi:hypothetical protein ACFOWE_24315 [Planomonospora corallina]|uniref:Uncharacterized protein n=1 Tax=Planomonospora corallina TaxID=1806052 RepID=A0ABV8IG12_9ACTN